MRSVLTLLISASLLSCSDSPSDVATPVSGVWMARIPSLGDSLDVQFGFGFDEVTRGAADGGVRAIVLPRPGGRAEPRLLKEGHTITRLTREGGKVVIHGTAHLGAPLHTFEFAGDLNPDKTFSFRYKSAAGSGSAVATYAGEYVRPGAPSLTRLANASVVDASDYLGTYGLNANGLAGTGCPRTGQCGPIPAASVHGSFNVSAAAPDGYGGIRLTVQLSNPDYSTLNITSATLPSDVWASSYVLRFGDGHNMVLFVNGNTVFTPTAAQSAPGSMLRMFTDGSRDIWNGTVAISAKQ